MWFTNWLWSFSKGTPALPQVDETSSTQIMADDAELTFDEIHGDFETLVEQMVKIQMHRVSRENILEWSTHLRFLCIPDGDDDSDLPSAGDSLESRGRNKILRLTGRDENVNERAYVAVSYCWSSARDTERIDYDNDDTQYMIQTQNRLHRSKAPASVLDRVIRFAKTKGIRFIWIDQECIVQGDPIDQEIGIQSMDQVYRRSAQPVGILDEIIDSRYVSTLNHMMKGNMKAIVEDPPARKATEELLKLINGDRWYSRAWIYQEEFCATERMMLLIRARKGDQKVSKATTEVQFPAKRFRGMTFRFCQALGEAEGQQVDNLVGEYAFDVAPDSETAITGWQSDWRHQQLPHRVLQELQYRGIQFPSDLLAIIANSCDYDVRLDSTSLTAEGYGFSTCALALVILNGVIPSYGYRSAEECLYFFRNGRFEQDNQGDLRMVYSLSGKDPLRTMFEGLSWTGFMNYHERYNSRKYVACDSEEECPRGSFLLLDVQITHSGVSTIGWLWKLGLKIDLTALREKYEEHLSSDLADTSDKASLLKVKRIGVLKGFVLDLATVLEKKGAVALATALSKILSQNGKHSFRNWLLQIPYRAKMLSVMMDKLTIDPTLQLGNMIPDPRTFELASPDARYHYTVNLPNDVKNAMAIFTPYTSDYVFTAHRMEADERKYRLVSLPVDLPPQGSVTHCVDGNIQLLPTDWQFGLWFAEGCRMHRYSFPWHYFRKKSEEKWSF